MAISSRFFHLHTHAYTHACARTCSHFPSKMDRPPRRLELQTICCSLLFPSFCVLSCRNYRQPSEQSGRATRSGPASGEVSPPRIMRMFCVCKYDRAARRHFGGNLTVRCMGFLPHSIPTNASFEPCIIVSKAHPCTIQKLEISAFQRCISALYADEV